MTAPCSTTSALGSGFDVGLSSEPIPASGLGLSSGRGPAPNPVLTGRGSLDFPLLLLFDRTFLRLRVMAGLHSWREEGVRGGGQAVTSHCVYLCVSVCVLTHRKPRSSGTSLYEEEQVEQKAGGEEEELFI